MTKEKILREVIGVTPTCKIIPEEYITIEEALKAMEQYAQHSAQERRSKARKYLGGWFFAGCPDSDELHKALDIASGLTK